MPTGRKKTKIYLYLSSEVGKEKYTCRFREACFVFDGEECLIYLLPLLGVYEEIGSKLGTNHMISWDVTKDSLDIQVSPNVACF